MKEKRLTALLIRNNDNVATAIANGKAGTVAAFKSNGKTVELTLAEDIPFGHKFAVFPIAKGERVIKYGYPIGIASKDIAVGEHVHIHNVDGLRCR